MTLPTTRDITLAPGTQIPSTLLNNLQDMITGSRHGPVRYVVAPLWGGGPAFDSSGSPPEYQFGTPSANLILSATGPTSEFMIPLGPLRVGETVNDIFVTASGTAAAILTAQFVRFGLLVGAPLLAAFALTATKERFQVLFAGPYTVVDPTVTLDEGHMHLLVQNGAASDINVFNIDYEVTG